MNPYVLGIVEVGEEIHTAVADLEGNVLGECKYNRGSCERVVEEVLATTETGNNPRAVVLGTDEPTSEDTPIPAWLQQFVAPDRITVAHVLRAVHTGAFGGRPGIVLEASEGSSCYGKNERGEEWMAGGWGHLVWGEGSAFWIGMEAIRAVTKGTSELLGEGILSLLGLDSGDALLYRLYLDEISRAEAIALSPVVLQAAESGDAAAIDIIRRGVGELAENVLSVARHLDMPLPDVAVHGKMVSIGEVFLRFLTEEIHRRVRGCQVVEPMLSPVRGACLMGLSVVHGSVPSRVVERLARAAS